ncbi:MAG TPA: hypothetical protein DDX54_05130 [Rhodospirillaceae bacterium]|nr:hypothetical protein [Rhodospirillaceae bacterium]
MCVAGPAPSADCLPPNERPMYGGNYTPTIPRNPFESQEVARVAWAAWEAGDSATAMRRFNQAWVLDPDNAQAYWGFGLLTGQKLQDVGADSEAGVLALLQESAGYFDKALALEPGNGRLMVDAGVAQTGLYHFGQVSTIQAAQRAARTHRAAAQTLFDRAEKVVPDYPVLYFNWSCLAFYEGDYRRARALLDKAKALGHPGDAAYEADLAAVE